MKKIFLVCAFVCGMLLYIPCVQAQQYDGLASYYSSDLHGRKSANGEAYNMYGFTCAHKTLAFGTKLKITNLNNQKSVIVTVTDRGPFKRGRIVDLSTAAAKKLDFLNTGVIPVSMKVLKTKNELSRFITEAKVLKPTKKSMKFKLGTEHLNKEFKFPNLLHDHQAS